LFRKILAALDTSERAAGVFDVAVGLARMAGARLYIMRVVTVPPEFPPAAAGTPVDPLVARMGALAMQDLAHIIDNAPDDVVVQPPIVRLGTPWKTILETADERDVDLIVVGSHGYHGWDRVLGTTAGKVANSSKRNVLVVHEQRSPARLRKVGPDETNTASLVDTFDPTNMSIWPFARPRPVPPPVSRPLTTLPLPRCSSFSK
jgi:nucleotide-binding universal stress UspA family protein